MTYIEKILQFRFFFLAFWRMAVPKLQQISANKILGDGPHWDHNAQALYYVDIIGHSIHKYVPATNKHTAVKIGM